MALVQSGHAASVATFFLASLSTSFGVAPVAGNLLWAAVASRPDPTGGGVPTMVVSSGGNNWTAVNAGGASDNHRIQIFYRVAGASEATSVTCTPTLAGKSQFSIAISIFEHNDYSADGWVLDKNNSGSNTGSTTSIASGTTGTLSDADELVVSTGTIRQNAGTLTNDSSLTNGTALSANARFNFRAGYKVVAATTAQNVTWTTDGAAASAGAVIATFMADGATNATATPGATATTVATPAATALAGATAAPTAITATTTTGEATASEAANASPAAIPVASAVGAPTVGSIPGAVSDLSGTPGDTQVVLTWSAPSDGGSAITDYIVEYRAVA